MLVLQVTAGQLGQVTGGQVGLNMRLSDELVLTCNAGVNSL